MNSMEEISISGKEILLTSGIVTACGLQRKFSDLKFKEALVTKGRPKKRTKQFSFNKTAAEVIIISVVLSPSGKKQSQVKLSCQRKTKPVFSKE